MSPLLRTNKFLLLSVFPDITLPDQEAHVGFVTSASVEDSLTDGVYE